MWPDGEAVWVDSWLSRRIVLEGGRFVVLVTTLLQCGFESGFRNLGSWVLEEGKRLSQ